MLKNKIKFLWLIMPLCFLAALPVQAAEVLTVEGNNFMLNGQPVLLRGVAVGSPHERILNFKRSSQADYRAIKTGWAANVVRLSVHPGVFLYDWGRGRGLLETEVAAARAQGLFVIIDWHAIGQPDGWYKLNSSGKNQYYSYNSDFNAAKDFWLYAANQYQNDRGVIFEIWNEPVNKNNDLSWAQVKPYLTELTGIIRQNGGQNIILLPGVWWTYDLRGMKNDPIGGENLALAWHVYDTFDQYLDWPAALADLDKSYPVVITEWGSNDDEDFGYSVISGLNYYNYLEALKNLIVRRKLSYTAWCWHPTWLPNMFSDNWQVLSDYGLLVKDFLNFPEKVQARISEDEKKKQQAESDRATARTVKASEFKLRLKDFIDHGADESSIKLGKNERRSLVDNFVSAFGHEPINENEWQDLMLMANGAWPYRKSQAAESQAKKDFLKIFRRPPDALSSADMNSVRMLAYGLRPRAVRDLKKEKTAIANFKKIFKRQPRSEEDWNFIRVMAYSGVKK